MSSPIPISLRDLRVGTIAGTSERGKENEATFHWPLGMTLTPQGDLLVANYLGHNIRLIDSKGVVTTYVGTGQQGFQNGHRDSATFSGPSSIVLTPQGDLLVTDVLNNCIRRVSKDGIVSIFAGTGQQGFRNGTKELATFFYPFGLIRTSQGNYFVLDKGNHSIRMINSYGTVSTYAGTGQAGCKDGAREKAMFNTPYGMCIVPERVSNRSGSVGPTMPVELYVADSGNHRVCYLNAEGSVATFAGVGGLAGFVDGPKAEAKFNGPRSLLLTPHGDLLVSDQGNQRIRIVETNGLVSTFTGCDRAGCIDGPLERASFSSPSELLLTASGDLYISDFTNNKIRHVKCPMWDTSADKKRVPSPTFSLASLLSDTCPPSLSDYSISLTSSRSSPAITYSEPASDDAAATPITDTTPAQVALGSSSHHLGRTWNLHTTVLANRCPSLLQKDTIERLSQAKLSIEAFDAFVQYLYCDELPELSLAHLCDLDYVLNLVELGKLSDHVRWIIDQQIGEVSQVEVFIALLGHVALHCGGSMTLVDLVIAKLRLSRSEVAEHMASVFSALGNDQPLLIKVMAKLLCDSPLESVSSYCNYSVLTSDVNDCSHFGHFAAQIEALYHRELCPPSSDTPPSTSTPSAGEEAVVEVPLSSSVEHHDLHLRSSRRVLVSSTASSSSSSSVPPTPTPGETPSAPNVANLELFVDHFKTPKCPPDFDIIVQGVSLKCHKAILYGRWPYFAGAMKMGGVEFTTNTMELPEDTFTPSLLHALLNYFYSNHVSSIKTEEDCLALLKHSLLFGFVDSDNEPQPGFELLMAHCRRPLTKPLTPKNCVGVLNTVLKYGNGHQQGKVRSYVARVLPDIMNDDKLASELELLGPTELTRILFEQFGRQTNSPARARPSS